MSFSATSPVVYTLADQGPVFERRVRQGLGLAQLVSLAGSEWTRSVGDDLGLTQSEFFVEALSNTLSLTSQAAAVVDRVAAATSAMSLIHVNPVAGGRIDGGVETIEAIFDSTAAKGDVIYVSSNGHVDLAQADGDPQARAIGLALDDVLSGASGDYVTSGPFTNTAWSLTPGSIYYLAPTTVAGGITATFPTTSGHYVIIIGTALTPTSLNIEIHWAMVLGT